MWGKQAQAVIWFVSYAPVFLIAAYRYFFEESVKSEEIFGMYISENFFHVIFIFILLSISILLYYFVPKWIFNNIEKKITDGIKGNEVLIKKSERPSLNDYTFFLLTLILPLITVDFTSIVSLIVCIAVISFIILLLTKIDYVIACPLFFVSNYKVFNVSYVKASDKKEIYIIKGFVITKHDDFYNRKFKIVKLIKDVYYLK
jgi:hypothetical protein